MKRHKIKANENTVCLCDIPTVKDMQNHFSCTVCGGFTVGRKMVKTLEDERKNKMEHLNKDEHEKKIKEAFKSGAKMVQVSLIDRLYFDLYILGTFPGNTLQDYQHHVKNTREADGLKFQLIKKELVRIKELVENPSLISTMVERLDRIHRDMKRILDPKAAPGGNGAQ